uniref:Uncharacterized protein n=1 Tax=Meloidogyne hapla TaxID=6305 RepID=A0A1I8BPM9_MELHA
MSNSFYVCLLSNVPDYPDNQPNKFRVHLPRPLYFSGDWVCGVHSISYPYSWSSTIGTLDEQWIKIHFIDENLKKNVIRIPVPAASHINVEALKNYLATTLKHQSDSIGLEKDEGRKDNMTQTSPPSSPSVLDVMGLGSDKNRGDKLFEVLLGKETKKTPNLSFLKSIIESIQLDYHKDFARFKLVFTHKSIKHLSFSPQLGYVLGFANPQHVQNNEIAKYGCDLRGGFSSFAIYAKGLTENMIVGNSLSSLLRIVSVTGALPGEYHEKIYDSPIYVRVLPREVNEIEVELRTMDNGRLVPFAYGTVSIVLIFKKVINF